jgi:tripartite-type tricarboxylate transporter receptor subunit TctC
MIAKILYFLILTLFFVGCNAQEIKVPRELQNKNINIIVGVGPGTPTDVFTRYLAKFIKENYDLNIVVLNRTGANGAIAAKFVAEANPDGTTLLVTHDAYLFGSIKNLIGWPAKNQLIPVAPLWHNHMMLVVGSNNLPSTSFIEILSEVKKNPNNYNYGCFYLIDCLILQKIFKSQGITEVSEVPFRSTPEIKNAMANNTIQFFVSGLGDGMATAKTGIWKPLAISNPNKLKDHPGVTPLREIIKDDEFSNYYLLTTLYLPVGSSKEVNEFYNSIFAQVIKNPEIQKFFDEKNYKLMNVEAPDKVIKLYNDRWLKFINAIK